MKTVYLIRHSKFINSNKEINNELNSDDFQIRNEKQVLSIEGEEIAKNKLSIDELKDLDRVYSSNYVRAIGTAKYLLKDDMKLYIDSNFGERIIGVDDSLMSQSFYFDQVLDENLKYPNGESRKETTERVYSELLNVLNKNEKRVAIVFHATAMFFLLMKLCDFELIDGRPTFSFNNEIIFNKKIDYCETFKLEFDDNNKLVSIKNIK